LDEHRIKTNVGTLLVTDRARTEWRGPEAKPVVRDDVKVRGDEEGL